MVNTVTNSGGHQATNLATRPYQTINATSDNNSVGGGGAGMNANSLLENNSAIAANAYANHDFSNVIGGGGPHQTLDH